jgi:hypothetical protein
MMAEGMTLRATASELRVSSANLSKWASQGMGKIDRMDKILRSKKKKAALTGPPSQLKAIEDGLLRYIFEKREQGIEIKVFTVVLRASFVSPEFRKKSFTARCSCVKRFMHAHSFSYRMGTHTLQQPPAKVESEGFDCDSCTSLSVVAIATAFHHQHGPNAGLFFNEFKTNS